MKITIAQIKELRVRTNAGMMDCRKALTATKGDVKEAITWLRRNGITKASKKADRVTSEGVARAFTFENKAILFVLNSETDFVSRNETFKKLVTKVESYLQGVTDGSVEEALKISKKDETLKEVLDHAISVVGENIVLSRIVVLTKKDDECFIVYNHANNQISSACLYNKPINYSEGKKIPLQIAAMAPKYISKDEIDPDVIETEKTIIARQIHADLSLQAKPEMVIKRIAEGRFNKVISEMCLITQELIMDTKYKVSEWLDMQEIKVLKISRVSVNG